MALVLIKSFDIFMNIQNVQVHAVYCIGYELAMIVLRRFVKFL